MKYPVITIPNANISPKPESPRIGSTKLRLFYAGRMEEAKGVQILTQAFDEIADSLDVELTMAGGGSLEEPIRQRYADDPRVRVLGQISQQSVVNWMNNSDALCVPSLWAENSPGVIIEAFRVGLPVVASDRGGIPELVKNGENGLLVSPASVQDLVSALTQIKNDPTAVENLRKGALKSAETFSQDHLGARNLAFIERIARGE